jgi:hypothetical protein
LRAAPTGRTPAARRTRHQLSCSLVGAAARTRSPSARHAAAAPTAPPGPPPAQARERLRHLGQHRKAPVIPARVPGTEHPDCERAGDPRPLRPPGHRHALPDLPPSHQHTRLPQPPAPGEAIGPLGGHTGMHAGLSGARQAGTRDRTRPVRGRPWKADGVNRPSWRPDAGRYMSVGATPWSGSARRRARTAGGSGMPTVLVTTEPLTSLSSASG